MIGKILIEINRLKNELDGYSAKEGLDYIKSYINTLSKQQVKEPDKSLEEEIERYLHSLGLGYGGWVDGLSDDDLCNLARHFAEWQKSQMLKDAYVESLIVEDGRIELEGDPLPCLNPITLLPYPQFKPDDKVKVIIVKED